MEKKYDDQGIQKTLDISTYLDPRFIPSYVSDKDAVVIQIVDEGLDFVPATEAPAGDDIDSPQPKKRKLGSWLKKAAESGGESAPLRPRERLTREIELYEQTIKPDADTDPLQWWRIAFIIIPYTVPASQEVLMCKCIKCSFRTCIQYMWTHCFKKTCLPKTT